MQDTCYWIVPHQIRALNVTLLDFCIPLSLSGPKWEKKNPSEVSKLQIIEFQARNDSEGLRQVLKNSHIS